MAQVYHIRTINGTNAPMVKSLEYSKFTMDKDSYRSASGKLIRNVIGDKVKFVLTFPPMNKTQIQSLLGLLNSYNFTVTYEDMRTNTVLSGQFYHGDLVVKPLWIKNEANTDVIYDVLSVSLIEY